MSIQAPEFHKGARVRVKNYGHRESGADHDSAYNGLEGTIGAVYGGKFYRIFLDDDPDGNAAEDLGLLAYAHEMEIVDE